MQCFVCYECDRDRVRDRLISCFEYMIGRTRNNRWAMCDQCHSHLMPGDTYVGSDESEIVMLIVSKCLGTDSTLLSQFSVPMSFPRSPSPIRYEDNDSDFVRSRAPSPESDDDKEN